MGVLGEFILGQDTLAADTPPPAGGAFLNLEPVRLLLENNYLTDLVRVSTQGNNLGGELGPDGTITHTPGITLWTGAALLANVQDGGGLLVPDMPTPPPAPPGSTHRVLLPLSAKAPDREFQVGDLVTVTGTRLPDGPRDRTSPGRKYALTSEPRAGTYTVLRLLFAKEVTDGG